MRKSLGERSSNIELLKILAIFLIVFFHFVQTYSGTTNLGACTDDVQDFALALCFHFGYIGNNIFFICSAWFLLDVKVINKKKLLSMLVNVWLVSVIILSAVLLIGRLRLKTVEIISCLLPTTFTNNWYITCYLLFCLICPLLNVVIDAMNQKKLLSFVLVSGLLYYVMHPLLKEWGGAYFYYNQLIAWILIYFLIAYVKRYSPKALESKKAGLCLLAVSLAGYIGLPLLMNALGKRFPFFEDHLLFFVENDNIFLVLLPLSIFMLFRRLDFHSIAINRISGCSLYVYIIHENILLRTYYRPMVYEWLGSTYGFGAVLFWILLFAIITLLVCIVLAMLYQRTLERLVSWAINRCYPCLAFIGDRMLESIVASGQKE